MILVNSVRAVGSVSAVRLAMLSAVISVVSVDIATVVVVTESLLCAVGSRWGCFGEFSTVVVVGLRSCTFIPFPKPVFLFLYSYTFSLDLYPISVSNSFIPVSKPESCT